MFSVVARVTKAFNKVFWVASIFYILFRMFWMVVRWLLWYFRCFLGSSRCFLLAIVFLGVLCGR